MILSIRSRNPIPASSPTAAGINASFPISSDISMAGIKSDHTEAATMTPEAKPRSIFWMVGLMASFMKKTQAAPKVVPINGIKIPIAVFKI